MSQGDESAQSLREATDAVGGLSRRLSGLTPAQRALLDLRARQRNLKLAELSPAAPVVPPIPRRLPAASWPLSIDQERIFFIHSLNPGSPFYNFYTVLRWRGTVAPELLRRGLDEIVRRHEIFRTRFELVDGAPVQIVEPPPAMELPVIDFRGLAAETAWKAAGVEVTRLLKQPFDLGRLPLVRFRLLRVREDQFLWVCVFHHIVIDWASFHACQRELALLYEAWSRGAPSPLPELALQYADYAVWQRRQLTQEALGGQLVYWRQQLRDAPHVTEIPVDRPRPAVQRGAGQRRAMAFSPDLSEALRALARRQGVTLFILFLTLLKALVAHLSGQTRVVIGSPMALREHPDLEPLLGFFVNHLVLFTDLSGDPSVEEMLGRVRETVLGAFAHKETPFGQVVDLVQPARDLSRTPLTQLTLAFLSDQHVGISQMPGVEDLPYEFDGESSKFDLTLAVWDRPAAFEGMVEFNSELFAPPTIARFANGLEAVLRQAAEDVRRPLSQLSPLSPAERHQLVAEWGSAASCRGLPFVHAAAADVAARRPDALAVAADGVCLSYGELLAQASALAVRLREMGVGPETVVGVLTGRSLEFPVACLAVLTAGGAYLPLDPGSPTPRLELMLEDAGAAVLLVGPTADGAAGTLAAGRLAVRVGMETGIGASLELRGEVVPPPLGGWAVGSGGGQVGGFLLGFRCGATGPSQKQPPSFTSPTPSHAPAQGGRHPHPRESNLKLASMVETGDGDPEPLLLDESHPAYLVFTSGSTGRPKGVVITHGSLSNLVAWHLAAHSLGPADRGALAAATGFDAAVFELWPPLVAGASLHVVTDADLGVSPAGMLRWLAEEGITLPFLSTPLAQAALQEELPAGLRPRALFTGGDALHALGRELPFPLVNLYGPTEGTVIATSAPVLAADARPAIGRPIAGARVHVAGRDGDPVPIGAAGELLLGGAGLARGYLHRPDLTAERFVPDPWGDEPGGRLYRTGDAARFLADGRLEIVGRLDAQVKVRGVRIEPAEVEAALLRHPEVAEAVVALHGGGAGARLVAWVVPREGGDGKDKKDKKDNKDDKDGELPARLRSHLRQRLPEAMVPSAWVFLAALPRNANGKIDRGALPALVAPAGPDADLAPRDPLEETLAAVWAEVLGVPRVGLLDDFFALGGHSLLAARVISRVRDRLGMELPLRALFEAPTVEELAARLRPGLQATEGAAPALVALPRAGRDRFPLSFAQERLWFLDRLLPDSAFYVIAYAVRLRGDLDPGALGAALDEIERRHEVLRSAFVVENGQPVQTIGQPRGAGLPLADLSGLDAASRRAEASRLEALAAAQPFDLAAGSPWRALLLCHCRAEHTLLLAQHHIVSDGWSVGVLHAELGALYRACREGRPSPLPPLAVQYADYAVWQRRWLQGETLEEQLRYWRDLLGPEPPVLPLPTDRPRPVVQAFRGAQRRLTLPPDLRDGVRGLGLRQGATPAIVLLAAFFVLLHRLTGESRILAGTVVAGRSRTELEGLLGFFVNSLVMTGDLAGEPSFRELLARVREAALGAYAHQDLPFERLVDEIAPRRDLSRNPLFQAVFVFQGDAAAPPALLGVEAEIAGLDVHTTHFDLELHLGEGAAGLEGGFAFDTDLFDASTIQRLLDHYAALLAAALADPEAPVGRLPLPGSAERHLLLREWNDTSMAAAFAAHEEIGERVVTGTVLEQVERRPDALAVEGGGLHLSYGELGERSRRLAGRLRALGVGPETVVGVLTGRTPELVVALLAILRTGGVYLPLDPALPPRRLGFILRDAGAALVMTRGEEGIGLGDEAAGIATLAVEESEERAGDVILNRAPRGEGSGGGKSHAVEANLAYIIYTSGSTGQPKGAGISHRSLLNLCFWQRRTLQPRCDDRISQVTSLGFDASIWELVPTLAAGASLHLAPEEVRRDPVRLGDWLVGKGITLAFLPTPLVHALLERELPAGLALRALVTGGEALQPVPRPIPFPLHNVYGPTECTVEVTEEKVHFGDRGGGPPSIGRPIDGARALVVDPWGGLMPVGAPGELWLGGEGLGRGYYRRPALTAERFVPDPFGGEPGARLYRTGDVVRTLADGRFDFLGRLDHQVKLRGFRIELGEIEAHLKAHPAVRQAVVVARAEASTPASTAARLVAYVVADGGEDGEAPALAEELRRHLREVVPGYMVPAAFVRLDALPLTRHGKVDRRALPPPGEALRSTGVPFAAPQTATEKLVGEVWQQVLGLDAVGIDDPFFDLGGNSLAMARTAGLLEAAVGSPVPLVWLFRFPTVRSLAGFLAAGEAERARLERAEADWLEPAEERRQAQERRRRQRREVRR